jgi:hypothetical protein
LKKKILRKKNRINLKEKYIRKFREIFLEKNFPRIFFPSNITTMHGLGEKPEDAIGEKRPGSDNRVRRMSKVPVGTYDLPCTLEKKTTTLHGRVKFGDMYAELKDRQGGGSHRGGGSPGDDRMGPLGDMNMNQNMNNGMMNNGMMNSNYSDNRKRDQLNQIAERNGMVGILRHKICEMIQNGSRND